MPSFADDIVLAILALLLFGPKKLPVLARELGKWIGEFRRASNEFKMQMEEEMRIAEQAERQKQVAAMEAAAPQAPALDSTTDTVEHPHLTTSMTEENEAVAAEANTTFEDPAALQADNLAILDDPAPLVLDSTEPAAASAEPAAEAATEPLPIATSGSLNMMPPSTGLPVAQSRSSSSAIEPLLESIPVAPAPAATADETTETAAHG